MNTNEELLTVEEASAVLRVSGTALRTAMRMKRLPYVKKYGRILLRSLDLQEYKQRTQPNGYPQCGRPRLREAELP